MQTPTWALPPLAGCVVATFAVGPAGRLNRAKEAPAPPNTTPPPPVAQQATRSQTPKQCPALHIAHRPQDSAPPLALPTSWDAPPSA